MRRKITVRTVRTGAHLKLQFMYVHIDDSSSGYISAERVLSAALFAWFRMDSKGIGKNR